MNLLDAAYNVVHDYPGGSQSLAPRLGKSATTLSHEVTATGTAKLGLLDAAKITELTGDVRLLAAFAANAGQMLVPLPKIQADASDDCMLRLADTAREFGDLCREVASDMADGVISSNDLSRIDTECGQLIASVHALREALGVRHLADKAALMRRVIG